MIPERAPALRPAWGVLAHREFRLFWTARTVSSAGDQVSRLALPTAAILILGASAVQVGILNALAFLAWPALALVAGVWVDRLQRRRILIVTDVVRAVVVASIPIAFVLGHLTLIHLYVVAAATGAMTVFFDLASTAHVPALLARDEWADGNSKLEVAQQAAAAGGPGLAGLLIGSFTAPLALAADAASFLLSGGLVARTGGGRPLASTPRVGLVKEMAEGLRFLRGDRALIRIMTCAAISNVGLAMAQAVQLLFLYRVMHLSPLVIGIAFGIGSLGALVGAAYNQRIMARLGVYRTLLVSTFIEGLAWSLQPLGLFAPVIPLLALGLATSGFFGTTWNVSVTTFRQRRIRPALMGRVGAASRMVAFGSLPVGSLLGGILGQLLTTRLGERNGLAITMAMAAVVAASSVIVLLGTEEFGLDV